MSQGGRVSGDLVEAGYGTQGGERALTGGLFVGGCGLITSISANARGHGWGSLVVVLRSLRRSVLVWIDTDSL